MASKDERLIERDPSEEGESAEHTLPFYKSHTFILVLKLSLALGLISSLLTGLIITNMRLSGVESTLSDTRLNLQTITAQQTVLVENLRQLTQNHQQLITQMGMLDLTTAKGELSTALEILDIQSKNFDKQLAANRNGLISLARMVKGSRVWQEDYRAQYDNLFSDNKRLKQSIKTLRGIQAAPVQEPKYIEMDF